MQPTIRRPTYEASTVGPVMLWITSASPQQLCHASEPYNLLATVTTDSHYQCSLSFNFTGRKDYRTCMATKIWGWTGYQTRLKGAPIFWGLYICAKWGIAIFVGKSVPGSAWKSCVLPFWRSPHHVLQSTFKPHSHTHDNVPTYNAIHNASTE